ncbi:MAG: OsmC family protein [Bacteroidia bacterium]
MKIVDALIRKENYTTEITARSHKILSDEPIEKKGSDKGLSPGELLAASLASCTSITLRMYANRKEYDIQSINTKVELIKASEENKENRFIREIQIEGNIDETIQKRMMQIANLCPVHKILELGSKIETQII